MIGGRSLEQILRALFGRAHYVALANMITKYPDFLRNFARYLTAQGDYPYDIRVRTPVGLIVTRLYSHHDLLTVNEIFCRQDYFAHLNVRSIIDLGSNIGISALYFLTRNRESKCFLYEPDPKNIEKLKRNLAGFEGRYTLTEAAVSDAEGELEFGVEPTGRYGGIGVKTGQSIKVRCIHINDIVTQVLRQVPSVDILKIDTEGVEVRTVEALEPALARKVGAIYLEANPDRKLHPETFTNRQYGSVRQLTNKQLPFSQK
jgi:FkbM family methyltransferase